MPLLRARDLPGNPASAVYGTILVAGQLAVEAATEHSTPVILGSLAATLVVFWLAHAYTDTLGEAINQQPSPSFRHALRAEWPIVESGLLPVVALLLAAAFGAQPSTAATAALVVTVAELAGWAFLAARRAKVGPGRRLAIAVGAAVLGLVLVAAKYLIH